MPYILKVESIKFDTILKINIQKEVGEQKAKLFYFFFINYVVLIFNIRLNILILNKLFIKTNIYIIKIILIQIISYIIYSS